MDLLVLAGSITAIAEPLYNNYFAKSRMFFVIVIWQSLVISFSIESATHTQPRPQASCYSLSRKGTLACISQKWTKILSCVLSPEGFGLFQRLLEKQSTFLAPLPPTPRLLPSFLKLSLIFTIDFPQKSQTPSNPRAKETSLAHPPPLKTVFKSNS